MRDIYDEEDLIELFYALACSNDSRNHFIRGWFAETHFLSVLRFSKHIITFEGLSHIRYHVGFELRFTETILLNDYCNLFRDFETNWVVKFV